MRVRIWLMAMGSAIVAGLAAVPPAAGDAGFSITCQMSRGGTFSAPMAPGGGSGTYSTGTGGLANRSHCSWNIDPLRVPALITTQGTFTASPCGTGTLNGDPAWDATTIDFIGDGFDGPVVHQMSYTLELRGWQGLLRVTHVDGLPELGGDDVDGALTVVPQHGCVGEPVETFTLEGAFTLSW